MLHKPKRGFPLNRPIDPAWARTAKQRFFRFVHLDPHAHGLAGVGGLFVLWTAGTRPRWVYAGATDDLARALGALSVDDDLMAYEARGGLYVTWSFIKPQYRDGALAHLATTLRPAVVVPKPRADAIPVPILPPGSEHPHRSW